MCTARAWLRTGLSSTCPGVPVAIAPGDQRSVQLAFDGTTTSSCGRTTAGATGTSTAPRDSERGGSRPGRFLDHATPIVRRRLRRPTAAAAPATAAERATTASAAAAPGAATTATACTAAAATATTAATTATTAHLHLRLRAPPPPPPPTPTDRACGAWCRAVLGRTLSAARARIRHAHCAVGRVHRVRARRRAWGRVVAQSPRAGSIRARGYPVRLAVGRR